MTTHESTLPNGRTWTATKEAHRRVWREWQALSGLALTRGEGVAVELDADGSVVLSTVFAPQWEAHRLVVFPDGRFCYASEQSAPEPLLPSTAPLPAWLADA